MSPFPHTDDEYLQIILDRLSVCKFYEPKFGTGSGTSLAEFRAMYKADSFYSWFGLDNPLVYAAHKAAGGITSIYRQIGLGCEELFRQLLMDTLGLTHSQATWSYEMQTVGGGTRKLALDGRIPLTEVSNPERRVAVSQWMQIAARELQVDSRVATALQGPVFEVRQGYKSMDSKRQNADIANAASAYKTAYLPCIVLLSTQIDEVLATRYRASGILMLYGTIRGTATNSTYVFCREVIGYDLAAFFERNTEALRNAVAEVVEILLSPA